MTTTRRRGAIAALPIALSATLLLSACGGGNSSTVQALAQQPAGAAAAPEAAAPAAAAPAAAAPAAVSATATATAPKTAAAETAKSTAAEPQAVQGTAAKPAAEPNKVAAPKSAASPAKQSPAKEASHTATTAAQQTTGGLRPIDTSAQAADNDRIAATKGGATDIGVSKDQIKLGTVASRGLALGNLLIVPYINGLRATLTSINDRGGILGRRLSLVDCDDGPGDVSRSKACLKKMVVQDNIFSLLGIMSWGSASIHDDLAQYKIPLVGAWAYSQTEWQDPFMFPTHMSMIHEAMAGAHWAADVIKPKTYGLICLTSPEMQLSCNNVQKIMDASGSKMVKRADVSISETSMSAYVLAFRAAAPEHIIHYVINPATMAKFMVEAAQQGYYPPKGISGNHLAAEVLGSLFGQWPVKRYWTNTTYKLWGPNFMSIMNKYAAGNRGINHHIVQAGYFGALMFERAAKAIGPNLTRQRLMAQLGNGDTYAMDATLDQRFAYTSAERGNSGWNHDMGQNREFMYEYTATNTAANPDGSPSGFAPDPNEFVIYAQ